MNNNQTTSIIKALPTYIDGNKRLKNAVGYARVSTESDEQDTSYQLQVDELAKDIKENQDYRYLGIFKDKASGRNTKYRNEFKMMITLARKKEIDVIVTKSISRFGRNLMETISVVRELRSIGVEIFFQKENISSLDDSFDFLFSVLASHAEEESNNISQNNLWSINKRKHAGDNFTIKMYGYKIINKKFHIVEDEAKVVRKIFDMYIQGVSYKEMIAYLYSNGIKTSTGNTYWRQSTLEGMLQNEKYCGDMILGKKRPNDDDNELILVSNSHEGIISKERFNLAQKIRGDRLKQKPIMSGKNNSPYATWVYSAENESYLRYTLEKPKGRSGRVKSEIPTLFCYGRKVGAKRIAFQVKTIENLLDQVIDETKSSVRKLLSSYSTTLSVMRSSYIGMDYSNTNDYNLLLNKHLLDIKGENLKSISNVLSDSSSKTIDDYRKLFKRIVVNNDGSVTLKISISNDDSVLLNNYNLIHETNFTYLKLFKPITLKIFVYIERI